MIKSILKSKLLWVVMIIALGLFFLSRDYSDQNAKIIRGVSFSKFHADDLGLDWQKTYLAILDDLGVKNLRLSAHWPMIEPASGQYNFKELDYQINEAQKRKASVILAVGRRLPNWPECHVPDWATNLSKEDFDKKVLGQITATVNRYKSYNNIRYWQVENEPFLEFFSRETCGNLDEDLLKEEIALVKKLDPTRKILVTDSGEFGTWIGAYRIGDVFGTSQYLYIWNKRLDFPFRYPIGAWFFNLKKNLAKILFGDKLIIAIEISSEPWLTKPISQVPIEVQLSRMDVEKFEEMIRLSNDSGFKDQYFWGAEWWYWLKQKGKPELWVRAKELFKN